MHKHYNLTGCWANLRGISLGITLYSNEHAGKHPDTLESMVLDDRQPDASILTCPVSGDAPIPGYSHESVAATLSQPGHVSYLYFGRNRDTRTTSPGTLIACDKPHNHDRPDYDCWALFADGSIRSIPRVQLER